MIDTSSAGTMLVTARSDALVAVGSLDVAVRRRGRWSAAAARAAGSPPVAALEDALRGVETDPVAGAVRVFGGGCPSSLFVLGGPPGVIAGTSGGADRGARTMIWCDPETWTVVVGLSSDPRIHGAGWLILPAATAVAWGPRGPELLLDMATGEIHDCEEPVRSVARSA